MRALAIAALLLSGPAGAAVYCTEPNAPYCASGYGSFDRDDFEQCRAEMERFRTRSSEYTRCLREEVDETVNRYNRAVESFNRRARGY